MVFSRRGAEALRKDAGNSTGLPTRSLPPWRGRDRVGVAIRDCLTAWPPPSRPSRIKGEGENQRPHRSLPPSRGKGNTGAGAWIWPPASAGKGKNSAGVGAWILDWRY